MAETHDWRTLYWHTMRYPHRTPYKPVDRAETLEQEDPYRTGRGFALRAPFTDSVLVVGRWEPAGEPVLEDEHLGHLISAMGGRDIRSSSEDIAGWGGWSTDSTHSLGPWDRLRERWGQWHYDRWERRQGPTIGDDPTEESEW